MRALWEWPDQGPSDRIGAEFQNPWLVGAKWLKDWWAGQIPNECPPVKMYNFENQIFFFWKQMSHLGCLCMKWLLGRWSYYYSIMLKIINKGLLSFQTDCVKATGRCRNIVKYEILEPLVEAELETPVSPTLSKQPRPWNFLDLFTFKLCLNLERRLLNDKKKIVIKKKEKEKEKKEGQEQKGRGRLWKRCGDGEREGLIIC